MDIVKFLNEYWSVVVGFFGLVAIFFQLRYSVKTIQATLETLDKKDAQQDIEMQKLEEKHDKEMVDIRAEIKDLWKEVRESNRETRETLVAIQKDISFIKEYFTKET